MTGSKQFPILLTNERSDILQCSGRCTAVPVEVKGVEFCQQFGVTLRLFSQQIELLLFVTM